ncbi:AAA family ATPase [Variovorax sp. RT4R15]|uniref:AAA family ATPase n=1 Tax=Variovorax sp. RT4R15 TaxID=3443737 RepID=UPI003F48AA9B
MLSPDTWNDFGYQTTFKTYARLEGEYVTLGSIQILFEEHKNSFDRLASSLGDALYATFPLQHADYVSTPATLAFYQQVIGLLGLDAAVQVAMALRDASYMARVLEDEAALALVRSEGFRVSLQRERGAQRAFELGWKLLGGDDVDIGKVEFRCAAVDDTPLRLNLQFSSGELLPHDINVLIGPNGMGKSQMLIKMVKNWLELDQEMTSDVGFQRRPRFSQIVAISYSPFEQFPIDEGPGERKDKNIYRYFGLRGHAVEAALKTHGEITLSPLFAQRSAAHSLLDCFADDQKYKHIRGWSQKTTNVFRVLNKAIEFDGVALATKATVDLDDFLANNVNAAVRELSVAFDFPFEPVEGSPVEQLRWFSIDPDLAETMDVAAFRKLFFADAGVGILKGDRLLKLSSGQRLFFYIVINVLGAMRRDCLVIVDEPELFLHPTLEIDFIKLLKNVLAEYSSKALIATHSATVVREVPQDCVHVLQRTKDAGIELNNPPFQTFGGDIQRISSYVFDDRSARKGYEDWIRQKLTELGTTEALINALGDEINEELLIQIHAMKGDAP